MELTDKDQQRTKSRKTFIMVIIAFGLPILLAKLALELDWLDRGVTNKGQLLTSELTLNDFGIDKAVIPGDKQWLMMYVLPKSCDELCQQTLIGINNTYIALGKEMPRVTPVGLYQSTLSSQRLSTIRAKDWTIEKANDKALKKAETTKLYLVDPLGNIFMSHQLPLSTENIPSFGKAVVADMKKLLKYSKVG